MTRSKKNRGMAPVQRGFNKVYKKTTSLWKGSDADWVFKREYDTPGVPPGTYELYKKPEEEPVIRFMKYNPDELQDKTVDDMSEALGAIEEGWMTWIDILGTPDNEMLETLEEKKRMHPLALEDVVTIGQRPKIDEYADGLFIVGKWFHLREKLVMKQVSMYVGDNFVITFQERPGDSFRPIRERIRSRKGRLRTSGGDYLAYAVIDLLIDNIFPLLEAFGDILEEIEDEIIGHPKKGTLQSIHKVKRELMLLRKGIWPMRTILSSLMREERPIITKETRLYLKDTYDHAIQIMDIIDTYRDLGSGLQDLYMNSMSNRMNEVMKVLTIIATIFIPLSFITGLYGMNFNPQASPFNMPELNWYFGYPFALLLMMCMTGVMLIYFRYKRWL